MSASNVPNLVMARLLDYFGRRTDWQRRLWNPGTVTVLQETVEAVDLLHSGHLRERTVTGLAATAARRAGPDRGVGPPAVRSALTAVLRSLQQAPANRVARHQLEHLLGSIEANYLGRWSDILAVEAGALSTEGASRILAGHLLGLGFSPDHLHRWATWLTANKPPPTLADLFSEAQEIARRRVQPWQVLVPFIALEQHGQQMPPEWLEPAEATKWMSQHTPEATVRHNGGLLVSVDARDPWSAVEEAGDLIESMAARVAVGMPGSPRFEPYSEVFVSGTAKKFPLARPRRQVDIHSLKRQNALFSATEPALAGRLRSAIDLVAPLETGTPGASVAGGWAALEAVLARPGTPNAEAAADLAVLVACSCTDERTRRCMGILISLCLHSPHLPGAAPSDCPARGSSRWMRPPAGSYLLPSSGRSRRAHGR